MSGPSIHPSDDHEVEAMAYSEADRYKEIYDLETKRSALIQDYGEAQWYYHECLCIQRCKNCTSACERMAEIATEIRLTEFRINALLGDKAYPCPEKFHRCEFEDVTAENGPETYRYDRRACWICGKWENE